jgi:hypothetical protein
MRECATNRDAIAALALELPASVCEQTSAPQSVTGLQAAGAAAADAAARLEIQVCDTNLDFFAAKGEGFWDKTDRYVKVMVGKNEYKTKVKGKLHIFDEIISFQQHQDQKVKFQVMDSKTFRSDEIIGQAEVDLNNPQVLTPNWPVTITSNQGKPAGKIYVTFSISNSPSASTTNGTEVVSRKLSPLDRDPSPPRRGIFLRRVMLPISSKPSLSQARSLPAASRPSNTIAPGTPAMPAASQASKVSKASNGETGATTGRAEVKSGGGKEEAMQPTLPLAEYYRDEARSRHTERKQALAPGYHTHNTSAQACVKGGGVRLLLLALMAHPTSRHVLEEALCALALLLAGCGQNMADFQEADRMSLL